MKERELGVDASLMQPKAFPAFQFYTQKSGSLRAWLGHGR